VCTRPLTSPSPPLPALIDGPGLAGAPPRLIIRPPLASFHSPRPFKTAHSPRRSSRYHQLHSEVVIRYPPCPLRRLSRLPEAGPWRPSRPATAMTMRSLPRIPAKCGDHSVLWDARLTVQGYEPLPGAPAGVETCCRVPRGLHCRQREAPADAREGVREIAKGSFQLVFGRLL
jgi:hypothetical protein